MSRSHDSRVRSQGRIGSQHVNHPQVFRRRQQGETSAQTLAPERDAVLQKLEYLTHAIERLEKNQATTRQISDSEAESPVHDKSEDRRVKKRLDFGDKSSLESKGGKSIRPNPPRKAATQRSVSVFDRLGQFVSTFMGARTQSTPKERLVSIKKSRTESLRSYIDRFSKRIVEVDKIFDDAALMEVLSGLRTKTQFWWSVHEDGLVTYQEFLARAEKDISAEEATSDQENDRSDQRDNVKSKEKDLKTERKESPKKALEFQHSGKDILKKPIPIRASSSELNQRKYCRYHQSAGHDTDDCQDLKGEIESLIRRGSRRQHRNLSREAHTSYQVLSGAINNPDAEKFSFFEEDASHVLQPHSDALVITMPVSGIDIHRTLVDDGSSVNVLYLRTFEQMEIDARHVKPFPNPLQGFIGEYVNLKGHIVLVVELKLPPFHRRIIADFIIVDLPSNYNAILRRPVLHKLKVAASIYHYAIKFSTSHGVGIVRGSQLVARSCNITFLRVGVDMLQAQPELPARRSNMDELEEGPVEDLGRLDPRLDLREQKVEPVEDLELIEADLNHPEKVLYIRKELDESIKTRLTTFLKTNIDVFAWEHTDMEGIDPKISCHRLNTARTSNQDNNVDVFLIQRGMRP
ncbi:Uncharacterized protein Adt_32447 [Abeliophyllum distichum]|uniref:Retrotransposon gag domain-containing protein n=1 Tax=Abeliophyllum distichum TaxID=126358 RepID=A0ABD1QTE6_9LAMI